MNKKTVGITVGALVLVITVVCGLCGSSTPTLREGETKVIKYNSESRGMKAYPKLRIEMVKEGTDTIVLKVTNESIYETAMCHEQMFAIDKNGAVLYSLSASVIGGGIATKDKDDLEFKKGDTLFSPGKTMIFGIDVKDQDIKRIDVYKYWNEKLHKVFSIIVRD